MVSVTVATLLSSRPSLALKVNVSVPFTFGSGVYVKAPVVAFVMVAVPFVPLVTMEKVSVLPSTSVATRFPVTGTSWFVAALPFDATGGGLTGAAGTGAAPTMAAGPPRAVGWAQGAGRVPS